MTAPIPAALRAAKIANELRRWWRFDEKQQHTHSWHDREDFIEKVLPDLLHAPLDAAALRALEAERDDLAMLVRMLSQHVRKINTTLADNADGYLARKGLQGSPLRAVPEPQP